MRTQRTQLGLLVFALILLASNSMTIAQELSVELPKKDQRSPAAKFKVTLSPEKAKAGDTVTLKIDADITEHWHIYPLELPDGAIGLATEIKVEASGLDPVDDAFTSSEEPTTSTTKSGLKQSWHSQKFSWSREYTVSEKGIGKVTGSIRFQACDDKSCLPPTTLDFSLNAKPKRKVPVVENKPEHKTIGDAIEVSLEKCRASRPKAKLSVMGLMFGSRNDTLSLKGTFKHEGKDISIFLPRARKFSLSNTGGGETRVQNNSTYISVDHNGDGKLDNWESHAANRPFRLQDAMYQITRIDKANNQLTLQQVDTPVSGSLVGQPLAPFEVTTVDGKTINNKSLLGKVTLLDVWAVT